MHAKEELIRKKMAGLVHKKTCQALIWFFFFFFLWIQIWLQGTDWRNLGLTYESMWNCIQISAKGWTRGSTETYCRVDVRSCCFFLMVNHDQGKYGTHTHTLILQQWLLKTHPHPALCFFPSLYHLAVASIWSLMKKKEESCLGVTQADWHRLVSLNQIKERGCSA